MTSIQGTAAASDRMHPIALLLAAIIVALLGAAGGWLLGTVAGVLIGAGMSLADHE